MNDSERPWTRRANAVILIAGLLLLAGPASRTATSSSSDLRTLTRTDALSMADATLTGNLTRTSSGISAPQYVDRYDRNPLTAANAACTSDNWGLAATPGAPPTGNVMVYDATNKWLTVTGYTGGTASLGDNCGGKGYDWTNDLSMSFDFKLGSIVAANQNIPLFVGFGVKTIGGSNAYAQGPTIRLGVNTGNGTPFFWLVNWNGSTATSGPICWGCISGNVWYHASLAYAGGSPTGTATAVVGGTSLSMSGISWSSSSSYSGGNDVDATVIEVVVSPPSPYSFLGYIDNMTGARDMQGTATWSSLPYADPFDVQLGYTVRPFFDGTAPSKICGSCWANASGTFWQRSTGLPVTGNAGATATLDDTFASSGSWSGAATPWSWTVYLFARTNLATTALTSATIDSNPQDVQPPGGPPPREINPCSTPLCRLQDIGNTTVHVLVNQVSLWIYVFLALAVLVVVYLVTRRKRSPGPPGPQR